MIPNVRDARPKVPHSHANSWYPMLKEAHCKASS